MDLPTEIDKKTARLPIRRRIAFCAGCAEHVVPIHEHLTKRTDARHAVDLTWKQALGQAVTERQGLAALARFRNRHPPDPTLEALIAQSAETAALGALNSPLGSCDGHTAFDAILTVWHADYLITAGQEHDAIWCWVRSHLTPAAREELRHIRRMIRSLAALASDEIPAPWVEEQKERGRDLLRWFRGGTTT